MSETTTLPTLERQRDLMFRWGSETNPLESGEVNELFQLGYVTIDEDAKVATLTPLGERTFCDLVHIQDFGHRCGRGRKYVE